MKLTDRDREVLREAATAYFDELTCLEPPKPTLEGLMGEDHDDEFVNWSDRIDACRLWVKAANSGELHADDIVVTTDSETDAGYLLLRVAYEHGLLPSVNWRAQEQALRALAPRDVSDSGREWHRLPQRTTRVHLTRVADRLAESAARGEALARDAHDLLARLWAEQHREGGGWYR